jgi:membrane-associated phospholipid phosphatase
MLLSRLTRLCFILCFLVALANASLQGQHIDKQVYEVSWKKDGPILGGAIAGWIGTRYLVNNADKATESEVFALDRNDVWAFDRGATNNFSESAESLSDVFLLSSFGVPLTLYLSHGVNEQGIALGVMLVETVFITDAMNNLFKATVKRYRPRSYNETLALDERVNDQARLSFLSGHTSMTAAMTFLSAKVLTEIHPDSKWNKFIWASAITIPAFNGYLRSKAGKHFPTDVMAGYALGAGIGLLIPNIHRSEHLTIGPGDLGGLSLTWTF